MKIDYNALRDAIKARMPLRRVVEQIGGVQLRGHGKSLKGLCPFHEETVPSFTVSQDKQLFHCFGCKRGGDVITFVQLIKRVDYADALEILADFLDIDIKDFSRPLTPAEEQEEAYYALLQEAADRYRQALLDAPAALKYLTEHRGLSVETIDHFGLGYAPHPLVTGDLAETLDLLRSDMWTDAIVIPLYDPRGRVAGFQTRPMTGQPQKYIHQHRTSPSWDLRSPLFAWHHARKHLGDGQIIIVEGAFDAIALHQAGFLNVVALLGSSLSDDAVEQLQSVTLLDDIVLMLDGDKPGVEAAARIAADHAIIHPKWPLRIATIPATCDPEDYLHQHGKQGIRQVIEAAVPHFLYCLDRLWHDMRPQNLSEMLQYFARCAPTLERLAPLQRPIAIAWLAKRTQIPLYDLWDLWYERKLPHDYHSRSDEERVLAYGLHHVAALANDRALRDAFYLPTHAAIYKAICTCYERQLTPTPQLIQQLTDGMATATHVQSLMQLVQREVINYDFHRDEVLRYAARRYAHTQLASALRQLDDDADADPNTILHRAAITLLEGRPQEDDASTTADQISEATEIIIADAQRTGLLGYSLGPNFPILNLTIDGLQPGRVLGLMSLTNVGKSTLAANFVGALSQQVPILWLSVEEQRVDVLARIWAAMSGVSVRDIRRGHTSPQDAQRVIAAIEQYAQSKSLVYSVAGWPFADILAFIREKAQTDGIGVFVLDYIQRVPLIGLDATDRYGAYGLMSKGLCNLCVEIGIAGILVAQLHRAARNTIVPTAESVGDSYRIVQDLDVVLTLAAKSAELQEQDGLEKGNILLHVAKNRCGPRGVVIDLRMNPLNLQMQEVGYSQYSTNRPMPPAPVGGM